ncbi:MAG: rubredoxin-like domain-containing protein [archaeon]
MAKFRCTKCKYEIEKNKIPKNCPYCGAPGTLAPVKTAQDLLNEVTRDDLQLRKDLGGDL